MSRKECIICGVVGTETILNGLELFRCSKCGLFWRRNFILDDEHYEKKDFGINQLKIGSRISNSLDRIETIKKYVSLDDLCDIGAGEGVFLKTLLDLGHKRISGIEPSFTIKNFIKENKLDIKNGGIEDFSRIFSGGSFKTITMFHVVEHLEDPKRSLKEIYDIMSSGSRLIIETPDMESYLLKKVKYEHELIYPEHFYYFNNKNIKEFLKKIGFKIIASGNRDFDPRNMSIKDSLIRLGICGYKKGRLVENKKNSVGDPVIKRGFFRGIIRVILSDLVALLSRGNYLWVIVEK